MRNVLLIGLLLAVVAALIVYLRRQENTTTVNQAISFAVPNYERIKGESLAMERPQLKYFTPSEFREWYDLMNDRQLLALDEFRRLWGRPVTISAHPDALGRHGGTSDKSQHNVDLWGEVLATDIFPEGLTENNALEAYEKARQAGFSGIGIYTDTKPSMMMHVDVRPDRSPASPAKWARVDRKYVGIEEVFA